MPVIVERVNANQLRYERGEYLLPRDDNLDKIFNVGTQYLFGGDANPYTCTQIDNFGVRYYHFTR